MIDARNYIVAQVILLVLLAISTSVGGAQEFQPPNALLVSFPSSAQTKRILLPPYGRSYEPVIVDSIPLGIPAPSGLCFDGEAFWVPNYSATQGSPRIYKINYRTQRIVDSIPSLSAWTTGMAWDGASFWTTEYLQQSPKLVRISRSGILQNRFAAFYSCYPGGIALDGTNLYYGTNTCSVPESRPTSMIFKVDTRNGVVLDSIPPPSGYISGLTSEGNRLWYCDFLTRAIYQISVRGDVLSSLESPGEQPFGLTFAKGYLWNLDYGSKKIYQIDIGLAPRRPQNLVAVHRNGCVSLSWSTYSSLGVREFKIYRGESPNPSEATYIGSASWPSTSYTDCTASLRTTSFWITAIDANGYESLFSNQATVATGPNRFFLSQNYPNPFNSETRITFAIPRNSYVVLSVFDILGQNVANPVEERKSAGEHTVWFNSLKLSSGIYAYRLAVDDITVSRKMIILR